jgi:hypothetical protein
MPVKKRIRYSSHSDPQYIRLLESSRAWKERNKNNPEYKRKKYEQDIAFYLTVRDSKEFREKKLAMQRKYMEDDTVRSKIRESIDKYRKNHPEVARAHEAVYSAICSGRLIRPEICSKCGKKPKPRSDGRTRIHAHHPDYNKPLEVEWLCADCHGLTRRRHL